MAGFAESAGVTIEEWARGRRVSIVIHSFDRGGSGRVAGYLARGFADLGMVVELLVFARGGEVEEAVTGLVGPGVPIRYFGRLRGSRPLDLALGLPKLVRALRAGRPDIVIAAANNAALVTAIAFRLAKLGDAKLYLKTTNPIASSRHQGAIRKLRLWGYRAVFRWVTRVWTLSAEETREMVAAFPRYASLFRDVANPYVTPAMLAPASPAQASPDKLVISVARLDRQKRLERLIEAFAHLRHRDARLLILGEGEERSRLTALVRSLGLEDRVAMPGHVADVATPLRSADLFVLTSDYEGLPAAVLEAMAADCPVLSTDCFPAARALLGGTDGCGVIDDRNPVAIAGLIDRYLDRPRPTGLSDVAERYSIANGIRSHVEAMADGAGPAAATD